MTSKHSLNLALTEPIVLLRNGTDSGTRRRRRQMGGDSPSILRAVLSLKLTKPMRITSIEAELIGESRTEWPEGIGARRIELSEHKIFLTYKSTFYRASSHRRALTVGPGTLLPEEDTENDADSIESIERNERRSTRAHRRLSADHGIFHRQGRSPLSGSPDSSVSALQHPQGVSEEGNRRLLGLFNNANGNNANAPVEGSPATNPQSPTSPPREPKSLEPETRASRRLSARLSLSGVLQDMKDIVLGSDSRQSNHDAHSPSLESLRSSHRTHTASPDRAEGARGRSRDRKEKGRMATIGEALGLGDEKSSREGDGWHEFRSGTYNYAVSFQLPPNLPPSIRCDFGLVQYQLKATVHRPGTFSHRITTMVPVEVVYTPPEEEVDDGDAIIVERQWDADQSPQLRYLLSIGGRHFSQGSEIPWTIHLMPLNKIKLYRISIILEERIEYQAHHHRITRADPPRRFPLLALRSSVQAAKGSNIVPLLPILSPSPKALEESGLLHYAELPASTAETSEERATEAALHLLSPDGPWHLHGAVKIPEAIVNISNKHPVSNITIKHSLKIFLRVDRGDDDAVDASGHKKQYDIIIETPITILSRHCRNDRAALPRYEARTPISTIPTYEGTHGTWHFPHWPISPNNHSTGSPIVSVIGPSQSSTPGEGTTSVAVMHEYEVRAETSLQFARLVAGYENEEGEHPPPYSNIESPPPPIIVSSENVSLFPPLDHAESSGSSGSGHSFIPTRNH